MWTLRGRIPRSPAGGNGFRFCRGAFLSRLGRCVRRLGVESERCGSHEPAAIHARLFCGSVDGRQNGMLDSHLHRSRWLARHAPHRNTSVATLSITTITTAGFQVSANLWSAARLQGVDAAGNAPSASRSGCKARGQVSGRPGPQRCVQPNEYLRLSCA